MTDHNKDIDYTRSETKSRMPSLIIVSVVSFPAGIMDECVQRFPLLSIHLFILASGGFGGVPCMLMNDVRYSGN